MADQSLPRGATIWKRAVPSEMTAWAISIRDDPTKYPMGAVAMRQFGAFTVAARVERHTWTWRNGQLVHGEFRGITLYEVPSSSGPGSSSPPSSGRPSPDVAGGGLALALLFFL